jgi:hypothetical protein
MGPATSTLPLAVKNAHRDLVNYNNEYRLYEAELLPAWNWFRWITCAGQAREACLYVALVYGLVGCSHREEERRSFRCIVTPTQVVFQQTLYECGCCVRKDFSLAVPVADIVGAEFIPECCCDPCCAQDDRQPVHLRIVHVPGGASVGYAPDLSHRRCGDCSPKEGHLDIWCAKDGLQLQGAVRKAVADFRAARAAPAYLSAYGVPVAYSVGAPKWQG